MLDHHVRSVFHQTLRRHHTSIIADTNSLLGLPAPLPVLLTVLTRQRPALRINLPLAFTETLAHAVVSQRVIKPVVDPLNRIVVQRLDIFHAASTLQSRKVRHKVRCLLSAQNLCAVYVQPVCLRQHTLKLRHRIRIVKENVRLRGAFSNDTNALAKHAAAPAANSVRVMELANHPPVRASLLQHFTMVLQQSVQTGAPRQLLDLRQTRQRRLVQVHVVANSQDRLQPGTHQVVVLKRQFN